LIKYAEPNITPGDIVWVDRVLSSGWLAQGPVVEAFEREVAAYVGAKYACAFNSGSSALFAAYTAAFPPGETVVMPGVTFVATANAAVNAQLDPVFSDNLFGRNVVPVHMAGRWSEFSGKRVVEDAAHALGSFGPDGKIGNCKKSDICVFSTHAIKNITTGEGGVATTNDRRMLENMRILRDNGRKRGKCVVPGWNLRMSEIQAGLGISQLSRIDKARERRMELYELYRTELNGVVGLPKPFRYQTFPHLFVIHDGHRDRLKKHLAKAGIQTAINYPLVYEQPAYRKSEHYMDKVGAEWARTCLSIPLHNSLKDSDVLTVCREIKRWREK
jgi:dTDP-4-amino-4,6-dideoxygalactose transaminase